MITQKIDPADSMLGFVVGWFEQIAARVDHLHVLALEVHPAKLPSNVTVWSMGKEHGRSRVRELLNFYRTLLRVVPQVDVVFSHMVPRYLVLAAPLTAIMRKRQLLWYVHRQVTFELKLALMLCDAVATAVPESFPLTSQKVHSLGHGVNTDLFKPDPTAIPDVSPLLIQVGRLVPIKYHATLIGALAKLTIPARVAIVGEAPANGQAYVDELHALAQSLGVADHIEFMGRKTLDGVRDLLSRSSVAVNLSPAGLFDKAALESMMCDIPTIVTTSAFAPLLGEYADQLQIAGPEDIDRLAEKLTTLLSLPVDQRQKIAAQIGQRARQNHSLDQLMDRLAALIEDLI
jgi:glycosyltransferase involved in cell wall biosynthesis